MHTTLPYNRELTLAISASDMNASIKWYSEVLGFELLYKLDDIGWAEMKSPVPGVNVGVSQVEQVKIGGATPTFGVSDIQSARSTLESRDVRFDGDTIEIDGLVKLATFFDPDGNSLMFAESLSKSC
tara:strand:+ start:144874 stop:145254 length:381 start_codon:yes stop_codon:yes gene_type:complete